MYCIPILSGSPDFEGPIALLLSKPVPAIVVSFFFAMGGADPLWLATHTTAE